MIFFNIPSVGHLKPSTLFGEDDHYGFLESVAGQTYDRTEFNELCTNYYQKTNPRYWDQIITLLNFLGLKDTDGDKRVRLNGWVTNVARHYDAGNMGPAKAYFEYMLCMWQTPHPILSNKEMRGRQVVKPYAVILDLLIQLSESQSEDEAFLTVSEFYWIGKRFESTLSGFDNVESLYDDLLEVRNQGGWREIDTIKASRTHLSYPKGFLSNSSVLSTDDEAGGYEKVFVRLIAGKIPLAKKLSAFARSVGFSFDPGRSSRNQGLASEFVRYLYDEAAVKRFLNLCDRNAELIEDYTGMQNFNHLNPNDIIQIQLKRLATLSRERMSYYRTEQNLLRRFLFDNQPIGNCAVCNREFPIIFLSTAHIKKRADCSEDEKRDLNVVMPACNLGCDILYEKGYLVVKDGVVKENVGDKVCTTTVQSYIAELDGLDCTYYDENRAKYFQSHENKHAV